MFGSSSSFISSASLVDYCLISILLIYIKLLCVYFSTAQFLINIYGILRLSVEVSIAFWSPSLSSMPLLHGLSALVCKVTLILCKVQHRLLLIICKIIQIRTLFGKSKITVLLLRIVIKGISSFSLFSSQKCPPGHPNVRIFM